tara:strand:+ start:445 stop:675 length:231 start_codon:yes stop_codon:yes gene_type:complete
MMKSRPADAGLPESIVVTRTFTYNVEWAMEDVEHEDIEPTRDAVIEYISSQVETDMTSPLSRHEIVWTDDNGNSID